MALFLRMIWQTIYAISLNGSAAVLELLSLHPPQNHFTRTDIDFLLNLPLGVWMCLSLLLPFCLSLYLYIEWESSGRDSERSNRNTWSVSCISSPSPSSPSSFFLRPLLLRKNIPCKWLPKKFVFIFDMRINSYEAWRGKKKNNKPNAIRIYFTWQYNCLQLPPSPDVFPIYLANTRDIGGEEML